jgi:sphingolipid delta-4 desaturase
MRLEANLSLHKGFKQAFFALLSVVYALRPVVFMPQKMLLSEYANYIVIICTNIFIYKLWGAGALLYLILGAFFSIGPHPAAMHVIAEHYEFLVGQ